MTSPPPRESLTHLSPLKGQATEPALPMGSSPGGAQSSLCRRVTHTVSLVGTKPGSGMDTCHLLGHEDTEAQGLPPKADHVSHDTSRPRIKHTRNPRSLPRHAHTGASRPPEAFLPERASGCCSSSAPCSRPETAARGRSCPAGGTREPGERAGVLRTGRPLGLQGAQGNTVRMQGRASSASHRSLGS